MDETSYMDAADEVMMPGFRFHPTDEELVDFYLKMKIQKKPLAIELIRQLDIYKYDPWDLPKLAPTGETEWYFYCPRGRKYRNSTRPNRVTVAGFWKATGADRPIYSSKETKCIGLKKSLVFYRGKAAKGVKTEWVMHEFRLPSPIDSSLLKNPSDKHTSTDESWTICRIFKKINSPKQKAQLESWVPPKPKTINSNIFSISTVNTRFGSGKHSCITEGRYEIQFGCNNNMQQQPKYLTNQRPSVLHVSDAESQNNMAYSSVDPSKTPPLLVDVAPIILKIPPERLASDRTLASKDFRQTQQSDFLKVDTQLGIKWNYGSGQEGSWIRGPLNTCNLSSELGENMRMMSSPINLLTDLPNEWKPYFTCHSEMSTGYSSSKCHN